MVWIVVVVGMMFFVGFGQYGGLGVYEVLCFIECFVELIVYFLFDVVYFDGWQKFVVGQLCQVFVLVVDFCEFFDVVVLRCEVLVVDWLVDVVVVFGVCFEVEIVLVVVLMFLYDGVIVDLLVVNLVEFVVFGMCCVWVVEVVDEEFVCLFVVGVGKMLYGLLFGEFVVVFEVVELNFLGWYVFDVVVLGNDVVFCFQDEYVEVFFSEFFGGLVIGDVGIDD